VQQQLPTAPAWGQAISLGGGGGGGSTRMSLARQIKQPIQLITELMGRLALVVLGGQTPCEWALGGLMSVRE
jgi:hypothetical protein